MLLSGGVACPFHNYVFYIKTGGCRVGGAEI